jgi:hypothetical protein
MIKFSEYLRFRLSMKPHKRLRLAKLFKSNKELNIGSEI